MKPLTIEQLKSLEVGDWVWIVNPATTLGTYVLKNYVIDEQEFSYVGIVTPLSLYYKDYGTKWLAYKNKEEAEAEEYKIYEEKSWGWMVSKYIPAHYKPWFTADTKAEVERRLAELKERKYEA